MAKSWNFRGVRGSTARPSGMENPGGWGSNWKNPPWGVWIFSGTTQYVKRFDSSLRKVQNKSFCNNTKRRFNLTA